jgi:GntR family transcriptional regulator/MocR family aminotransferase
MREFMFHLKSDEGDTLQTQLRQQLLGAILDGQLAPGQPLPSSRRLAKQLGVARNTVTLTYQALVEQGFLVSRERSGFYVSDDISDTEIRLPTHEIIDEGSVDWSHRFVRHPSEQRNIAKPRDWQRAPYPFIYGQVDPKLFPLAAWRECSRRALGKLAVAEWSPDLFVADDPLLIEQIRTRVLPRRGVLASDDQILVTMGAQNALWLLASLLMSDDTTVGLEDPGYVDARNIFALRAGRVKPLDLDQQGLVPGAGLKDCDYVYVTPSHQSPTTVTMPYSRRVALLEQAEADDFILIEDDYEGETNYVQEATPALKSIDRSGRVLYIGSLSKSIAPGLRMGYLVGPREMINEARQLRRLVMRHPPSNNQRCVALFIADGHFDSLVHKLRKVYRERWEVMRRALETHLPQSARTPTFGGTSFWVCGPKSLDANALARAAWEKGVIIEPGDIHFLSPSPPKNFFRLGFSSIETDRIEPGIELLADLIRRA